MSMTLTLLRLHTFPENVFGTYTIHRSFSYYFIPLLSGDIFSGGTAGTPSAYIGKIAEAPSLRTIANPAPPLQSYYHKKCRRLVLLCSPIYRDNTDLDGNHHQSS